MDNLSKYFGLAGVSPHENKNAMRWDGLFNFLSLWVVVWLFIQMHHDLTGNASKQEVHQFYLLIWAFFILETCVLTYLVTDRQRYLKHNWMNGLIILLGFPLLFIQYPMLSPFLRLVRYFFLIGILIPWVNTSIKFLTDNRLDTTVFAAVVFLVLSGLIIDALEPDITSLQDGIWWAWVTISTVGYGDITPKTSGGRLFAGVLILIGMGIFSIITANFAALFVQRDRKASVKKTLEKMETVHQDELRLDKKLDSILKRIARLEKKIEDNES